MAMPIEIPHKIVNNSPEKGILNALKRLHVSLLFSLFISVIPKKKFVDVFVIA
jgi:hypothetical protein